MKYNNDDERKAARRLQNRLAKQRQRANIKLEKTTPVIQPIPLNVKARYAENLFTECAKYPFSHSITLTNKKQVTLNMHNKAVGAIINYLVKNGIITNYVHTVEYFGVNFHSHLVMQQAKFGFDFKQFLTEKWYGDGFFRLKLITTNLHRINAVKYCFKQIDVTSHRDLIQALADSWSISLVQSFDDLNEVKSALLHALKARMGLNGISLFKPNVKTR